MEWLQDMWQALMADRKRLMYQQMSQETRKKANSAKKFITLPADHKLPTKEELKGKDYCQYQHSWNHSTNSSWSFRNAVQERINKGILKFPEKKKESILIDPFRYYQYRKNSGSTLLSIL
ncbi:hypothetical protein K1719_046972 [Acacia pycnantha]|nr:hypothetical protein K1719_046972 [Acacia pycnantha]